VIPAQLADSRLRPVFLHPGHGAGTEIRATWQLWFCRFPRIVCSCRKKRTKLIRARDCGSMECHSCLMITPTHTFKQGTAGIAMHALLLLLQACLGCKSKSIETHDSKNGEKNLGSMSPGGMLRVGIQTYRRFSWLLCHLRLLLLLLPWHGFFFPRVIFK